MILERSWPDTLPSIREWGMAFRISIDSSTSRVVVQVENMILKDNTQQWFTQHKKHTSGVMEHLLESRRFCWILFRTADSLVE